MNLKQTCGLVIGLIASALLAACGGGGGTTSTASTPPMGGSIQGTALNLSGTVTTLAGTALHYLDGASTIAKFSSPYQIVGDGSNLYVADSSNQVIRKVSIATGAVTTLAGSAGVSAMTDGVGSAASFKSPAGMTLVAGNLYVVDYGTAIRKVEIATGTVTTLAGSSTNSNADGVGAAAGFNGANGITSNGTNLFVTDYGGCKIRQVVISSATVTTPAGSTSCGYVDATGTAAKFQGANGITWVNDASSSGSLYLTDSGNANIRRVDIATWAVTTYAGSTTRSTGAADGTGTAATFHYPAGISSDGSKLYVSEAYYSTIRQIALANAAVTTLAGQVDVSGHANGSGTAATFYSPRGMYSDGSNLYVADANNNLIRKIVIASGAVTTFAGSLSGVDGTGAVADFSQPFDVATDGSNLYVTDANNNTIRKIVIATGEVTTLAGTAGVYGSTDGTGAAAQFNYPQGITTDGTNLYVVDENNSTIRRIVIATGAVTTVAGTAGSYGSTDDTGAAARFNNPVGITTDGTNLYVTDNNNSTIRKIVIATGAVTTLAGTAGTTGGADGTGAAAQFFYPVGITTDGTNLYVADSDNNTIRKIVIATGAVTTLAGTAGAQGSTDATGAAAQFYYPQCITTDGTNLYVTDDSNHTIRKIVIATGVVTTVAGTAGTSGSTDGTGAAALFYYPAGITTDGSSLYVADQSNNTIRKIH